MWQASSAARSLPRGSAEAGAGTSDATLSCMILFEIFIWLALGAVVGLSVTYFDLWRGKIWQVSLLGAAGAVVGALLLKIIPGTSIDGFDVLALFGALIGATALVVLVGRRTGRALPMS